MNHTLRHYTLSLSGLLLVIGFIHDPVAGQTISADSLWNNALRAYRNRDYDSALGMMRQPVLRNTPALASAAQYFEGQLLFETGSYSQAKTALEHFLKNNPAHAYAAAAGLLLTDMQFLSGDSEAALQGYVDLYASEGETSELGRRAGRRAARLYPGDLTLAHMRAFRETRSDRRVAALWNLKIAARLLEEGDLATSRALMEDIRKTAAGAVYEEEALRLARHLEARSALPVHIGLLLPSIGPWAAKSRMVYEGIKLAVELHNADQKPPVYLKVEDFDGTPAAAARVMDRFARQPGLIGVLGPVAPQARLPVALQARHWGLPTVMPFANESELSEYHDYTWRIRADLDVQGRALGRYAMQETDHRRFAVVASVLPEHRQFAEAFIETIDQLGGNIVSVQYYYPGTTDLQEQFTVIRNAGFELMFRDSLQFFVDTLGFAWDSLDVEHIDSLTVAFRTEVRRQQAELLAAANYEPPFKEPEWLDAPVTSIDGLCLLANDRDAPVVFSQFRFYNLQTALYGGPDWYRPDTPREDWEYPNGLLFSSDLYLAEDDPDFREFRNRFRIASRRDPDHAAVLGYNAMQVLLQALRGGARSREALRDQLTHMPEVNGIGGRIVLDTQRGSNTNVKILRLIQGGAVPVIRAGEAASRETESVAP